MGQTLNTETKREKGEKKKPNVVCKVLKIVLSILCKLTCSVHGRPCTFEGAQAFATKRDILLAERHRFCLENMSPLLLPKDRLDCFQEVLFALWRTRII